MFGINFFPSREFLKHILSFLTKFQITPLQATGHRPVNFASHTKLFIPTIFHTLSLSLCLKFLLTQFLTNHSTFSSHLQKINRRPHQIATVHKGYTDSPSPYDRMQLTLKEPTSSTQISSPISRSEVPHKHRQHHKASSGIS